MSSILSGYIVSATLILITILWAFAARYFGNPLSRRVLETVAAVPAIIWYLLGLAAFVLPVFEYWITAKSHGNALAGFLPWNDAAGYYFCAEKFLLGIENTPECGRRPFYAAFLANLLWLTSNGLQPALLLQALIVGAAIVLLTREIARTLNTFATLAAYAVLYLFTTQYAASLTMTENAGLLLGVLGMALLWRTAATPKWRPLLLGIALMAAGQNARAGAMFVLPALIGWIFFHVPGSIQQRLTLSSLGVAAIVAAMALTLAPTFIVDGAFNVTQSNFSYSFYGLAVGGKGWTQVMTDHPEIFTQGGGEGAEAKQIYEAAFESILNKPHLFVVGYLKGLLEYFDDLFRFATDFKPLRLAVFLPLWIIGIWAVAKRWREPRYALLLWLQAGILFSSPFISFDGGNRVYAATMSIDALFVGLGMMWVCTWIASEELPSAERTESDVRLGALLPITGAVVLFLPVVLLAVVRPDNPPTGYEAPQCAAGLEAVTVRPGRSTLFLSVAKPGEASLFPLRVQADHFAARMHKTVYNKEELRRPAGTVLFWGLRLDQGAVGGPVYFSWAGESPPTGEIVGVCIKYPEARGKNIGTAEAIYLIK